MSNRYPGATNFDNLSASAFPKMLWPNTINAAMRNSGVFWSILNMVGRAKMLPHHNVPQLSASNFRGTTGNKYEMKITTVAPGNTVIENAADEVQPWSAEYDDNLFATSEFELTKFLKRIVIPEREIENCGSDVAKTKMLIQEYSDIHTEGMAQDFCTRIWQNNNQSKATLGGIPWMVADDNQYVIDRSQPEGELYKANVVGSIGALKLRYIAQGNRMCGTGGASARSFWALDENCLDYMQYLLEDKVQADVHDNGWSKFGGSMLYYDTTPMIFDRYIGLGGNAAGSMFRIDPMDFIIAGTPNINVGQFKEAEHLNDARVAKVKCKMGLFIKCPVKHYKGTGVTAPSGY